MKPKKLMLAAWLVAAAVPCFSQGAYTEIVAFGDSLTDMGNRGIATNSNSLVYPHQTWVKQLAGPTMLDISPFTNSGNGTFTGGTNYAYGGATTKHVSDKGLGDATGRNLTNQITSRYLNPSFNTGGVLTGALHVLYIGGNDINFMASSSAQISSGWSTLSAEAALAAKSAEGQIQALATAGVTDFVWANVPDFAKIPVVKDNAAALGPLSATALSKITAACQAFNTEMDAAIVRLKAANPGITLIKLDMYAMFNAILANPAAYGLTNVTGGSNNDSYLFTSDRLHPTSHGHAILADFAYENIPTPGPDPDPEPEPSGDLIAYEGFNYAPTTSISTAADSSTDIGWTGTTWGSSNDVISPGLTRTGYPSEANALQFSSSVGAGRLLNPAAMPDALSVVGSDSVKRLGVTGTELWVSFLIRADGADADNLKTATLNLTGSTSGGSTKLTIGDLGTSGGKWAVGKGSTVAESATTVTQGNTVLLVARIKFIAGSLNDEVDLFVNPTMGATAPTTPSAMLRNVDIGSFDRVEFKGSRQATGDELAIGSSWSAVTGATPPPSTSSLITYDGFDYAATTSVSTAADSTSDYGWTGTTWSSSNDVINPGLTYTGYFSEGNALQFSSSVGASRTIDPAAMPDALSVTGSDSIKRLGATGTELWVSFLIRADGTDADNTKTAALYLIGSTTGGMTKLSIGDLGSTGGKWSLGKASTIAESATTVTQGNTVLLVARIKFIAGSLNDEIDLFVNPTISATAPTTPSAMLRNVDIGSFHRVEFKGSRQATADELAIGENWASVAGY